MASKVVSTGFRGFFVKRPYAAQAVTAKKTEQPAKVTLAKQDAKTTTLPNGLIVASIEDYSPLSRVGVMVKAGPRYEPADQLGLSHCLRTAAGLETSHFSSFRITKDMFGYGANLSSSCSRENVFYDLSCSRDDLKDLIPYLAESVTQPLFLPWEISSIYPRMKLDIDSHNLDPIGLLMEAVHKAAFRGGLRNSLYSPAFMLRKHSSPMLQAYTKDTFRTGRAAIVALGVDHDQLLDDVNKWFKFETGSGSGQEASKFKGGELYVDADLPVTYAAVVTEGAGLNNQKDMLCLALLQKILGEGPQVKYSESAMSKLGAAAKKATSHPFAVSGLNINYSDTGLFGFCVIGQPEDMDKLLRDLVKEMRTLKTVSAKDIATAKQRLKACVHMSQESRSNALEEMAVSTLSTGQLVTASDLDKAIDAISAQDITNVTTKVLKSKPAIAALGKLQKTPYLDDLL